MEWTIERYIFHSEDWDAANERDDLRQEALVEEQESAEYCEDCGCRVGPVTRDRPHGCAGCVYD